MGAKKRKSETMKICILGLGVIGTTYGYAFQKAGHHVEHLVRAKKIATMPNQITVKLLDGRYNNKGEEKEDIYDIALAQPGSTYDFVIISVPSGNLKKAVEYITENRLSGSLLLFCNFWNERSEIDAMVGGYSYIIGFPTAGGHIYGSKLNCVLFDHIMLEQEQKTNIQNYDNLTKLLASADLKTEVPHDMVEWIWLHMAINAGVTSTAAKDGKMENPRQLALGLMEDSKALSAVVRTIRETVSVVAARGVDLKRYSNELLPYKLPAGIAGIAMKKMFSGNELTSRIMTLHSDISDILYGCSCVYDTAKERGLDLPLYYNKMDVIYKTLKT